MALNDQVKEAFCCHPSDPAECLKKVLVYKDKYQDYKQKVKQANTQITVLTQRVARFEMERGISAQGFSSQKPSPGKPNLRQNRE